MRARGTVRRPSAQVEMTREERLVRTVGAEIGRSDQAQRGGRLRHPAYPAHVVEQSQGRRSVQNGAGASRTNQAPCFHEPSRCAGTCRTAEAAARERRLAQGAASRAQTSDCGVAQRCGRREGGARAARAGADRSPTPRSVVAATERGKNEHGRHAAGHSQGGRVAAGSFQDGRIAGRARKERCRAAERSQTSCVSAAGRRAFHAGCPVSACSRATWRPARKERDVASHSRSRSYRDVNGSRRTPTPGSSRRSRRRTCRDRAGRCRARCRRTDRSAPRGSDRRLRGRAVGASERLGDGRSSNRRGCHRRGA